MNPKRKITEITRRNISDELFVSNILFHGRLNVLDFLNRLFELKSLPSTDGRYNNAYDDIYKHMIINSDWEENWVFYDERFKLMHCDDELFLKFLSETLHPAVRNNEDEIKKMLEIYNRNLQPDGYEIIQISEISGKPVFGGRKITAKQDHSVFKQEITKYLNTEYVHNKTDLMIKEIETNTDLAIGTAKELIETTCKSILKHHSREYDETWKIGKLLSETNKVLDFSPKHAKNPDKAEKSIKQILGGIKSIINGVAELRNAYGSGHGKEYDFVGLESKYARLIVGTVEEIVMFYLATNEEKIKLFE